MSLGKLDIHVQKNEVEQPCAVFKSQLKIDQRPNLRAKILKLLEENIRAGNDFLNLILWPPTQLTS